MNILLLGSVMSNQDFEDYSIKAKIKPNQSNQNFYSKLVKALSLDNRVIVLSRRPFAKGMFPTDELPEHATTEDNVNYYYSRVNASKSFKLSEVSKILYKEAKYIIDKENIHDFVILVDSLRPNLLKLAKKLRKRYSAKVFPIVTDNPLNLSVKNGSYARSIFSNSSKFDGYIALTEKLNKLFNINNKPSYIFEGFAEDVDTFEQYKLGKYFFFGGALYERYGVKTLLDSFHKSSSKNNLVIAGTGPLADYVVHLSKNDNRIVYLGMLPRKEIINLEHFAIANINPRPFSNHLDRESVPSKVIEYLASGGPTVSTMCSCLHDKFYDEVIWLKDDLDDELLYFFNSFDERDPLELKKMAEQAKIKAIEIYGLKNQAEGINHFLDSIINSFSINRDK